MVLLSTTRVSKLKNSEPMLRIFKVDTSLCVACRACVAACALENSPGVNLRHLYTFNENRMPDIPIFTLSLACNHCETAACQNYCPALAYARDIKTGAVIIDGSKCIGCGYCTWNCPYGAPVLNESKGFIEKCSFCNNLLKEGYEPACSAACPTGALAFSSLEEPQPVSFPDWFPEKELNPAISISSDFDDTSLKIIPEPKFKETMVTVPRPDDPSKPAKYWSLVLFSLSVAIASGIAVASLSGISDSALPFPNLNYHILIIILLSFGWLFSLFHLKNKIKGWRSMLNISNSPLSREILFFLSLGISSVAGYLTDYVLFTTLSGILAIFLLITVDSVYTLTDKRNSTIYHSGQLFLSGFTIAAFLSGMNLVLALVIILRIAFSVNFIRINRNHLLLSGFTFIRILLFIGLLLSFTGALQIENTALIILLLAGELLDRILYYSNFRPLHISTTFEKYLTLKNNETHMFR